MRLFSPVLPVALFFFAFVFATNAHAIGFTLDGATCGSCQGADLSIDIVDIGGGFDVTITLNADDYTGKKDGLVQIGFGGIKGWTAVALDSSPGSSTVAWANPVGANVSSSGLCKNGGSTDKICTSGFVDISGGGDFTWTFTVKGGTLNADTTGWHLGGQYADLADLKSRKGPNGNIISESGPARAIPEPGAALLFGIGLLCVSRRSLLRAS